MDLDPVVKRSVEGTVGLLARGEYDTLARMTGERRLTAMQLRDAVEEYGRTLRPLPEGWPADALVVETLGGALAVTVDLWTVEEGRSDLSIELLLTPVARGLWETRIDNIRVL